MKAVLPVLLMAGFLGGCVCPRMSQTREQVERQRIERVLEEVFAAAKSKDWMRLDSHHAYGPKFTKFGSEESGRQDESIAREGEHRSLGALEGLEITAEDLKIDLFGDVAISTSILKMTFTVGGEAQARSARATLVLLRESGQWKITHEHISPVPGR